jgi:predicted DNA-binding transcriptional regulator AlpA
MESDHMFQPRAEAEPSRRVVPASDESLITGKQLRQMLGNCSEMHIWRLLNKQELQPLAFPTPTKINSRNYWRLGEIRRWISDQEAKSRKLASATQPAAAGATESRRRRHQVRRKHR